VFLLAGKAFWINDPPRHEEVVIFLWKINGFRMAVELRELRSNGAIRESSLIFSGKSFILIGHLNYREDAKWPKGQES
jgi:hypothetical protein